MSETLYKIKRSGGQEPTTWIGAAGCKRKFDPEVDVFIVNEVELGICLHHGNFKLLGPADATDAREPESTPEPISVPALIMEDPGLIAEDKVETDEEKEEEEEENPSTDA